LLAHQISNSFSHELRREQISKLKSPRCLIIAGPNGAGKTTFAREFLPKEAGIIHFVNADLKQGGHDVSRNDVLRRFERGWDNFQEAYKPLADSWELYDNSGDKLQLIEMKQ
jgi:predicted ABC-type ATPase